VQHASTTADWYQRVFLSSNVHQQMLDAMPTSSPREIAEAVGYHYSLKTSQLAVARNRLTAMAHIKRTMA